MTDLNTPILVRHAAMWQPLASIAMIVCGNRCPTLQRLGVVTPGLQVKILYDSEKKTAEGQPRPKGAAFIEFTEHQHAVAALRALNNNPGGWVRV